MNQQIEKLAMEANNHQGNSFDLNYKELDVFLEKFAELLLTECLNIAWEEDTHESHRVGYQISKHFGLI